MNCREFQNVAESVLEGDATAQAYEHLAACRRCRVLVDELVAITDAARALPLYEPNPRLWARLQAAAEAEGLWTPVGRESRWLGVASLFLPARPAYAGALAAMLLMAAALVAPSVLESPDEPLAAGRIEEVAWAELVTEPSYGQRYQVHLQQVEQRMREAEPADTEITTLAAEPLDELDRAIGQTQSRLEQYPEDSLAREELNRLYQQKATVLQAMNAPAW